MSDKPPFNAKRILDNFEPKDSHNPLRNGPDLLTAGAELRVDQELMSKEDFDNTVKIVNMGLEEKKQRVVVENDQIVLADAWSGILHNQKPLTKRSDANNQKEPDAIKRNLAYNTAKINHLAGE